jgi:aryl-alcohol dehydrogenase-like predicted oxidoreductase
MLLRFAHGPQTIRLGDHEVRRLGYGAMRLPGKDVWGKPEDPATAHAVLRRAIELGVNFIDTAWYYGPLVSNRLIAEALHPYPRDLVIATKLGAKRLPDRSWKPALRPEELRVGLEDDLRTLRLDHLPIVHLRWIPQPDVTFLEALDVLIDARRAGKLAHIALSNVSLEQLTAALDRTPIAAVQNVYIPGKADPAADAILAECERRNIAFIPFPPPSVAAGTGVRANEATARRVGCSPAQLALAWLLARSRVMLPIPGTSKVMHLEENVGSVHVALDESTLRELAAA